MSRHVDYVIKNPDGLYLTREPIADRWSETLADAYIFHLLTEAEERRDAGDIPESEVFRLASDQKHMPRTFPFDLTFRVEAQDVKQANETIEKMAQLIKSEFSWGGQYGKIISIMQDEDEIGHDE